jgi:glucose-1-phosphate adenylyltransferase
LRDTVIIGADWFETDAEKAENARRGVPNLGVGDDSHVAGAILDKDCRIGRGVRIENRGKLEEAEGVNFVIREGVVVIPKGAVVADGTVL